MDAGSFRERMIAINDAFDEGAYADALRRARAVIADVRAEKIIAAEQIAWPLFYVLKSLHAQADWLGYAAEMREQGVFMVGTGPRNHAYTCSLMMEALYRAGTPDEIPRWGAECCALRILDEDYEALNMAIATARNLLQKLGRLDLELAFLEQLIEVGRERELQQLSVYAQRWALAAAGRDEAALSGVRRRLVARLPQLRELALASDSGVIELLSEVSREEWFLALLDPRERRRLEIGGELLASANEGDIDAVMALLDEAGDPNVADAWGRTALGIAAFANQEALVRALLRRPGIDVNLANAQRRTPLAQAADQGHAAVVERLLAAGASPDVPDLNEQTALILASWQDHAATVKALIAGGARLDLQDRTGNTALSLAATEDVPEVITALLDGGAALDAVSPQGHTALMKAAMEGMTRNVELLLARGADVEAVDQHGMTALDWARQEGHEDAAALLKRGKRGMRGMRGMRGKWRRR